MKTQRQYRNTWRRALIDKHIGDWDERFLSKYDPKILAQSLTQAKIDGAMIYFQSHLGLCYWPTKSGIQHKACTNQDFAGETLNELHKRDIPVCAYYSIGFNNEEYLRNPNWRIKPAAPPTIGILPSKRYGIVCLNNLEYKQFVKTQIEEILCYDTEAFFFDMVWWNGVCVCPSCQSRYFAETGKPIPTIVNWQDSEWIEFQTARENWLKEYTIWLRDTVRATKPKTEVYHNFALSLSNWTRGINFESVKGHDFLGGDFYGDKAEQMFITRLMLNLTPNRPAEFMTTISQNLTEHNLLRPIEKLKNKAFIALLADAALLLIAGIDPIGTLDKQAIERMQIVFETMAPFEEYLGGTPVEEVAVYFSSSSRMNRNSEPTELASAPSNSAADYPHFYAATNCARILNEAHIAFGVITKSNLGQLDNWPVIIVPNVNSMDQKEIRAFEDYVQNGGKILGTRSSLEFLGAAFGASKIADETGDMLYLQSEILHSINRPLSHKCTKDGKIGACRIKTNGAQTLAYLTLPYAYPKTGSCAERDFASIHSWPPLDQTNIPCIIKNNYGHGQAIYCAADIECNLTQNHDALFLELLNGLRGASDIEFEAHKAIWISRFDLGDGRYSIRLYNSLGQIPSVPIDGVRIKIHSPTPIKSAFYVGSNEKIEIETVGAIATIKLMPIVDFTMIILEFEINDAI